MSTPPLLGEPLLGKPLLGGAPLGGARARGRAVAAALGTLLAWAACTPLDRGGVEDVDQILLADVAGAPDAGAARGGGITGDGVAAERALLGAAATAVQQWRGVRPYPRARLPFVFRLMRREGADAALSYDLAREAAERDHVRYVLGLWLAPAADGWRVSARLTDVRHRRDVATAESPVVPRDELVAALGDVLARVHRALGDPRRTSGADVAAEDPPLSRVTTASLEALRSYDDGSRAWRAGDYQRAAEYWRRAVDLDTGFAMALGALGSYHYYVHDREQGERYYAAALSRTDRLTEYETLRLRGGRASFRGERDSAIAITGQIARRFPSATAWYDYGSELMRANRDDEAIAALRRSAALDSSHATTWINLATTFKGLGRLDEALRAYARAGAVDSAILYRNNIIAEYGVALVEAGRRAEAESLFHRVAASSRPYDRALALRSLGYLAEWEGRVDEAAAHFREAVAVMQQARSPLSEGRNRLLLAGAYRLLGRPADADSEVTRALALARDPTFEPGFLVLVLYACQRQGRARDVEAVAALVHARVDSANGVDRASATLADAVVQLVRQRPESALALLRRAASYPVAVPRLLLVADAFEAAGRPDSVRATLLRLVSRPVFGYEGQDDALRVPLRLGDLLLQAGDTTGALRQYRVLLERWRAAPRDFPDLIAARERVLALGVRR